MKQIMMEVRKRDRETGEMESRTIDMSSLDEFMTPGEIFNLEFTLNGIPWEYRFHISVNDSPDVTK